MLVMASPMVTSLLLQCSQDPDSVQVTPAPSFDMEKVKTTIKQFFRDWSKEVNEFMC